MALLTVQVPAAAGTVLTLAAASGGAGDTYPLLTGTEIIVVDNASGGPIDVTFVQKRPCNQGFNTPAHDIVQSVANGAREMFPCPNPSYYADENNIAQLTYSATGSVTVAVMRR